MTKRFLAVTLLAFLFAFKEPTPVLPVVKAPVFRKDTINIMAFGAKADGLTLNTKSINDAIAACSGKGGGVVVIPEGLWLTGPIGLKNNVNLHLRKNALLQFTRDFNEYQLVQSNWEGLPQWRNQSPLYANGQRNIAITGDGIIDGGGEAWRMVKRDKMTEGQWKKLVASGGVLSKDQKSWYPTEMSFKGSQMKSPGVITPGKSKSDLDSIKDFLRPNLLVFNGCKGVLLEGVTFQNSPAWCLHPLMCEEVIVRNVFVKNPWYAQNGDGIDLESCKNVIIENSIFDVGDDGICIKSGRDEEGRKRGKPTENVIVRNNTVYHAHGGFVVGSEMSGGARNIFVDNCTFIGTDIGIRFKTTRGRGGIVEKIYINNISMKDIVAEAILFDMYYAAVDPVVLPGEKREPPKVETQPVSEATPQFRDITVSNVVCNGAEKAVFVRGLPEMNVKNIVLKDMVLQAKEGLDMTEGDGISFQNVKFYTTANGPVINIHNSKNINLESIGYKPGADLLMNVSGDKTKAIVLSKTDMDKAKQKMTVTYGASEGAVQVK
ncbi:glycoside hydrolase family 28 protein [Segetibacter sp. 3557_3]|uniref:glycoside hydrolase family 28 protein n=1 Tax=Segetibacter sp. 3557_3 TaxID=2547429 RepID=UPI0010586657|nr:glycoside hydrolase family 28 protein [Segetibacter sp. 3557_3]TDH27778.1 glycoside hydrolase family 28 protein [Segetibacter sp. 3557_3]